MTLDEVLDTLERWQGSDAFAGIKVAGVAVLTVRGTLGHVSLAAASEHDPHAVAFIRLISQSSRDGSDQVEDGLRLDPRQVTDGWLLDEDDHGISTGELVLGIELGEDVLLEVVVDASVTEGQVD
ncbi:MAG: hypothetical protein HZB46_03495 [Solirubrobacterales bacterium]|nr:hypothetical protein [Solirubrobacterales bacterium]